MFLLQSPQTNFTLACEVSLDLKQRSEPISPSKRQDVDGLVPLTKRS